MAQFTVLVSDYDYPDLSIEENVLNPIGAEVVGVQCKTGEHLIDYARHVDAILIQYAKVPRSTIEQLSRCKVLARYGAGVDIVDVGAAYERGIVVTNVPYYCVEEVAEHVIALAFMLLRRLPWYERSAKTGHWHWSAGNLAIHRFSTLTWGQIGLGNIGKKIVNYLSAFGFTIFAFDPYVDVAQVNSLNVKDVSLETLLKNADVVCLQVPLTGETRHLIGEDQLKMMKTSAVLINCARGPVVDNKALYRALTNGWIASAGLDDPEEEPAKLDYWDPGQNQLFSLDNCIITPHCAYYSEESLIEARRTAAEEVASVLLGKTPKYIVRPNV